MAWNYRKRIKILPGVHINLSKGGVSTSVGPRGAKLNFGPRGTYLSTGIPGTGLYNRQKISGKVNQPTNGHNPSSNYHEKNGDYRRNNKSETGCLHGFLIAITVVVAVIIYSVIVSSITNKALSVIAALLPFVIIFIYAKSYSPSKAKPNQDVEDDIEEDDEENRFNKLKKASDELWDFVSSKLNNDKLVQIVNNTNEIYGLDLSGISFDEKIQCFILYDAYKCLKGLGGDVGQHNIEEDALHLLVYKFLDPEVDIEYAQFSYYERNIADSLENIFQHIIHAYEVVTPNYKSFLLAIFLDKVDPDIKIQYILCLHRFTLAMANVDDVVTSEERVWLQDIMDETNSKQPDDKSSTGKLSLTYEKESPEAVIMEAARIIVQSQDGSLANIQREMSMGYLQAGRIMDELEKRGVVGPARDSQPREVLMKDVSELFELVARSTKQEKKTLNNDSEENTSPENQLSELIGLESVKEELFKLKNFIHIQQVREEKGLKTSPMSYHCVFTGNPGTGKTTVARILAAIYKELGILEKGHLVETDRSGLVAEYVGQTAVKTNKIIDSALDGVLFIDEAYSLVQGGNNDYGKEAISTLLKRMEDDRNRLVVILAGYGNEMKEFIDSNPGLQSRFNRYIHFDDYNEEELLQIYQLNLSKNEYSMNEEAEEVIKAIIKNAVINKDKNFGNARYVRNLFEKTLENQATRLAYSSNLTAQELVEITAEDLSNLE